MKTITYIINETAMTVNEKTEISYGISCLEDGHEIESINDLSPDHNKVKQLVDTCNKLKLDPVHLNDVAEDCIV